MVRIVGQQLEVNGQWNECIGHFTKFLSIKTIAGIPVVWLEENDDVPEVKVNIIGVEAGWELPADLMEQMNYIDSAKDGYENMWHFYWMPVQASEEAVEPNADEV